MNGEFVPIHRDEDWQQLDRLDQKVYATYRAYRFAEDEVKDLNDFSVQTVLDVAGRYASYDLQLRILADDQMRLRDELEGYDGSEALDIYREWRMELEAAVRSAQLGNFSLLKRWFGVCQSRQEYAIVDLDLKSKLDTIIQVLPNKAEPLKLPIPAWQDPKFDRDRSVG